MAHKVALLGAGRIGVMHGRILADLGKQLVIADPATDRAATLAQELGAEVATEDEVFAPGNPLGLDAAVLASPTSEHARQLIAAAAVGLPTFSEKPLAMDIASAREAVEALEAAGLPHHIGFQRRFDVAYTRARDARISGALGEVRRFHMLTADQFPPDDSYIPTSGGIFRDCNIHDFDIIRWVTGAEVAEVYATGSQRGRAVYAEFDDLSEATAILTLDDETVGTVHSSRYNGQGYDVRLDLAGTDGSANVGYDNKLPIVSMEDGVDYPPEEPWTDFIARFLPCYRAELEAFFEMVDGDRPSPCEARDALEALYVAVAADISRHERRPVKIDEVRNG